MPSIPLPFWCSAAPDEIERAFGARSNETSGTEPIYHNAQALVIGPDRQPGKMTWGFDPAWPTDYAGIWNAREESLRRVWREPFASSRCVIPATSWSVGRNVFACHTRADVFCFLGLVVADSRFIVITRPSPESIRPYMSRTPIAAEPGVVDWWLDHSLAPDGVAKRLGEVTVEAAVFRS